MWDEAVEAEEKALDATLAGDHVVAKALAIHAQQLRDEVMAWSKAQ